jgi:glycosyltransferase involved in cell wall biosynthesis
LSAGNGDVEDHRIDHLGYLTGDNLKFFYSRIDILIFTSKQENLSNVLLNAVASGIYVLCYDVGGNKDIVNQDDLGKVFQRNELNELASYLGTINLNDLRRGRKSRALRFREKWKLQVETEVKAEF